MQLCSKLLQLFLCVVSKLLMYGLVCNRQERKALRKLQTEVLQSVLAPEQAARLLLAAFPGAVDVPALCREAARLLSA